MDAIHYMPEICFPVNVAAVTSTVMLMDSPRRRKIESAARKTFLGTIPEDEWEVHHRDHENRAGCKMNRVAFNEEKCSVVQRYGTQTILKTGLNRPLMIEI